MNFLAVGLIGLVGLVVGVLIGSVGIGGVLLVPALTYLGGYEIHVTIASCMLSYLFSGMVGAVSFARRGSIQWSLCAWLCLGAMPGSYLGAVAATMVAARWLELLIACLIVFAGIHSLKSKPVQVDETVPPGPVLLFVIGALTGVGSAMSGTGGPLILVPVLVWMNLPVLMAVGLSQVIQVPVSILATVGNVTHGSIDWILALSIAGLLMAGVLVGVRIAHRLPAMLLRRSVAIALLLVGGLMIVRVFAPVVAAKL